MPTYVYKFVKTGETVEVEQAFTDDALTTFVHPRTKRRMAVKKVFTPVGVTFRGNGFYKTDSRASSSSKSSGTESKGNTNGSESKGESSATKTDSKSDSKPDSSASSASTSKPD